MERSISATDANREFSRVLNEVAGGETYVVTSHGKPVARLEPVRAQKDDEVARQRKVASLVEELALLPLRAPGRILREDGYE